MIDHTPEPSTTTLHPRTATSFEIRRRTPDGVAYDVYIDGTYVPWNITREVTVQKTESPGLELVHLALIVEGEIILDDSLRVTHLGEGRDRFTAQP